MKIERYKMIKTADSRWQVAIEEMGKEVKMILSEIVEKLKGEYRHYSPFYVKRHSFV